MSANKTVIRFKLEKSVFVCGKALKQSVDAKTMPGISMQTHPWGVLCSLKGTNFIVPIHNIQSVEFESDEPPADSAQAVAATPTRTQAKLNAARAAGKTDPTAKAE